MLTNLIIKSPAPAASLAAKVCLYYLSYNFPITLLAINRLKNIDLFWHILQIIIGISELINCHVVFKYHIKILQRDT